MSNVQLRKRHLKEDDTDYSVQKKQRQTARCKKDMTLESEAAGTKAGLASKLLTRAFQLVILLALVYLLSPLIFRYSPFLQRSLLFMNFINFPLFLNMSTPEVIGLRCTRTLQVKNGDITYGTWHILPGSIIKARCFTTSDNRTTTQDADAFDDSSPIIFYLHGNGGSRGGNHRNELYKRLAYEYNYHIVTFDYRGYADSTNVQPSAGGLSDDSIFMYNWLLDQNHVDSKRIIVWGHSLGTAIATRMVSGLRDDIKPKKMILEAPFDTLANAIANHPFSTPFRVLPFFEYFFIEPVSNSEALNFDSAKCIVEIRGVPILIMHAQDDVIIPYGLGEKLYKLAAKNLGEDQVDFISVDKSLGLGHKHICRNDKIMKTVRKFIESTA